MSGHVLLCPAVLPAAGPGVAIVPDPGHSFHIGLSTSVYIVVVHNVGIIIFVN